MPDVRRLEVETAAAGERLDAWLARRLPDLSRSRVQALLRDGAIQLDGRPARASARVRAGQAVVVDVPRPAPAEPQAEDIPLRVLHEDARLIVLDKPPGLVVHPGAGGGSGTLVNALLHHVGDLSGVGGVLRPGIVHRLDRGTSGVMVVAKTDEAHRALSRQFQERHVGKEYLVLAWGTLRAGETLSRPIGRDPRHRQKMSSRARRTRSAVTRVVSAEPLGGVSFAKVTIGTGRTHQIRVHLSEAGHPIVGDALYGGGRRSMPPRLAALAGLKRPFLHASRLTFAHPSDGRSLAFESPLPSDLAQVLAALRRASGRPTREPRS
jgi:23S rRNA pseudouridine1911/1915/1917 synthase